MVRGYIHSSHPSYLTTFVLFCLSLLIVLPHPPDSKFDPKLMDEDTTVPLTRGNLFDRVFKSLCEVSELKLYHEVPFDLAKVYTPSLAVHPAVDEETRVTLVFGKEPFDFLLWHGTTAEHCVISRLRGRHSVVIFSFK